jgi:hypothetical protein
MEFVRIWLTSYFNPARAVDGLASKPAPRWGLYGVLIRCAVVSLLWYLPAYGMGRIPPLVPRLAPAAPETYYRTIALLFPLLTLAFWLLDGLLAHGLLLLLRRPSNLATILNVDGFANLIITPLILGWDWLTLARGASSETMLWGLAHLLLDAWYIAFVLLGLKKMLRVPTWLAVLIVVLWFAYSIPISMALVVP